MKPSQKLIEKVSERHILKHPFYQAWNEGSIPVEALRVYAAQYYHHVKAFPRYLSATHSGCEDLKSRQVLLANLNDEEHPSRPHPELWMQFAEALGISRAEVEATELLPETTHLITTFTEASRSSYAEGLGALLAYEHQIPEVSSFKLKALDQHYQMTEKRAVEFFEVHREADVWHTEALSQLMDQLPAEKREAAETSAKDATEALWGFLDGIVRATGVQVAHAC